MTFSAIWGFIKRFWIPIVATIVIISIVYTARSCYVDYKQKQAQEKLNKARQEVIDAIVAEEAADVEGKREEAENIGKNTNEANKKLDDARNTDSSRSNSNASAVKSKFCATYPTDSLCQ